MKANYPPALVQAIAEAIGGVVVQDLEAELSTEEARRVEAVAVLDALADATGGDVHTVRFFVHDFTLQHPITERLNGSLFECRMHALLAALNGPPALGDHRVWIDRGALRWEAFEEAE